MSVCFWYIPVTDCCYVYRWRYFCFCLFCIVLVWLLFFFFYLWLSIGICQALLSLLHRKTSSDTFQFGERVKENRLNNELNLIRKSLVFKMIELNLSSSWITGIPLKLVHFQKTKKKVSINMRTCIFWNHDKMPPLLLLLRHHLIVMKLIMKIADERERAPNVEMENAISIKKEQRNKDKTKQVQHH